MDTIELGRFAVAADGGLTPRRSPEAPALLFAWRGRRCHAQFDPGWIRLTADAARIPSTADPGADRPRAFAAVATLPHQLPEGWHARLLPDHRIRIGAEAPMLNPSNATALVAAMVRFALVLDPYLDALVADGASPMTDGPR